MKSKEKFIQNFEKKVRETIKKYGLASKKDKIVVACSGGKDSTTVLYLLKKFGYDVSALFINLLMGQWSKKNLENLKKFCKQYKIKLYVVDMRKEFGCSMCYLRSSIKSKTNISNCAICGVVRRWLLNKKARQLGADKIATGHNLDDEVETILMNVLKGNLELSLGFGPTVGVIEDKRFVPRIKPLYFCTNDEIKKYSKIMKFPVLYQPCPCLASFRKEIRELIPSLEKIDKKIKMNLVENFLNVVLPIVREKYKEEIKEMRYCKTCGEPSRNEICKRCSLIEVLHKD